VNYYPLYKITGVSLKLFGFHPCQSCSFDWSRDVFTEGSLSQLDWNNVVAAGGAVLACLTPLPEAAKGSRRNTRKHYHAAAYPTSDIDPFQGGLSFEEVRPTLEYLF
jgi:hypothetical protein